MVLEDIGYTIFTELLGMTQYPGSPFTGNIVRDLILFLFVPSVFIIMFVIVLLGRIITPEVRNLRILVGVALYMFIVASGYYAAFALLAGPYFIFLIFILGVLYFIPGHFALRARGAGVSTLEAGKHKHARGLTPPGRIAFLRKEIAQTEADIKSSKSDHETEYLRRKLDEQRDELYGLEHPWEKK